jgi:hypothetical protein
VKRKLALVSAVAAGLLALFTAVPLDGATRATPLDGAWSGGGHALRISGSLEGGFTISAGESWTIIGCPVSAGTVLTTYSPAGGSSYTAQYLWTESENGKCTNSTRGPETVTVVYAGPGSLTITGCGYAFCGSLSRSGPAPGTTTAPTKPVTTSAPATTTRPPTTTRPRPTTTAPARDTRAPVARALPARGAPGAKIRLSYTASDDSGKTKDTVAVLRGSTIVAGPRTSALGPSVAGKQYWVMWTAPKTAPADGKAYRFCVRSEDAAGNRSATSCAAVTILFTDTSPPEVWAFTKGTTRPATRDVLRFRVEDDSGKATFHATLYDGGTPVATHTGTVASGSQQWQALFASNLDGPLFFCVWAEDAAGNRSAKAPKSSCAWISLVVPIDRVSNGCGGGLQKWGVGVLAQNYFGNLHTFHDFGTGHKYTVNFAPACDVHDAGYGGHTVVDSVRGGIRDFHNWTRKQVDDKFLTDLRALCNRAIPATAADALANCVEGAAYYALPVNHLIGAETLYGFVRRFGDTFFDSDLTRPGLQRAAEKRTARDSFEQ